MHRGTGLRGVIGSWFVPVVAAWLLLCPMVSAEREDESRAVSGEPGEIAAPPHGFDCAYRSPEAWQAELRAAVERGEIPDPRTRPLPAILRSHGGGAESSQLCVARTQLFAYEDTDQLLLTDFSDGANGSAQVVP